VCGNIITQRRGKWNRKENRRESSVRYAIATKQCPLLEYVKTTADKEISGNQSLLS